MPPTGMPSPSRTMRVALTPMPSGTPYERAIAAPVSSTQPTPRPMPRAAVMTSVIDGIAR
jgi:hypothetical protein